MSRRTKGPRLYLDQKRQQWVIRDGARFIRTGCGERDSTKAEKFLAQYIGHKHRPEPSGAPMIAEVLNAYGTEVAPHKKSARNIVYSIGFLLKWWGAKTISAITAKSCREYVATRTPSAGTADLKVLKAGVAHWHAEYGPLASQPVFWRPAGNPPKEKWLTRSEAAQLLWAAKPYLHLRRLILLGLYTGSRPGVILALRWNQIDLRTAVMSRLPAGVVQDQKKRAPKVRLGRRILAHLRRWKRLDGHAADYVCHYEGRAVEDPHTSWRKVIKASGLEGVTRHTLRHTRATWMMQANVPIWEAAGFLGMTMRTLEKIYAHHDPSHQEKAANI